MQACQLLDKAGRRVLKLLCYTLDANQYTLHQLLDNVPHASFQSSARLSVKRMTPLPLPAAGADQAPAPAAVKYSSLGRQQEPALLALVAGDQPELQVGGAGRGLALQAGAVMLMLMLVMGDQRGR
jgi:hypothetical protein